MFRHLLIAAAVLGLIGPGEASAGWVTIKNETTQPVIVQETCLIRNQVRKGKPIKLLPGEVFREYRACPGSKCVHILDVGGPPRTLARGELTWEGADESFAVRADGGAVAIIGAAAGRVTAADPRRK